MFFCNSHQVQSYIVLENTLNDGNATVIKYEKNHFYTDIAAHNLWENQTNFKKNEYNQKPKKIHDLGR